MKNFTKPDILTKGGKTILQDYRQLRDEIDARCEHLHLEHKSHTQCRKGCNSCCMDFRLLPVEFHFILNKIEKKQVEINFDHENGKCIFLINGTCSIYKNRPVICRSHGLPILYTDVEFGNLTIAFCPLNFQDVNDNYFTIENSYNQDVVNQKLFTINRSFIENCQDERYSDTQMIEMSRLADYFL